MSRWPRPVHVRGRGHQRRLDVRRHGRARRDLGLGLAAALSLAASACKPDPPPVPPTGGESDAPRVDPEVDNAAGYFAEADPTAPRELPAPVAVHGLPEAIEALSRGNARGARDYLEAAFAETDAATNGADPEFLRWLARARWHTGDYEAAIAATELALAAKPDTELALQLQLEWIDRNAALGRREAVDKRLEQLRADMPDRIELRGRQLAHWLATGRADSSEAKALMESLYDDFDAGRAESAAELFAVARAAVARGSTSAFKDASWVLEEAEKLAPPQSGSPLADEIMLFHAEIFAEKYADDEAEASLAMILERNSWHPTALASLAEVNLTRLRLSEARRLAREALLVDPHQPDAHAVLARIDTIEGERAKARARIDDEVLSVNPHHAEGLAVAAALAIFEDDADAAQRAEAAALAWHSGAPSYFTSLGDLLGFLHLYVEADEQLTHARELSPENPYVLSAFGLNRLRLGDEAAGRPAIEAAFKRDKFNERTLNTRKLYTERIDGHYRDYKQGSLFLRVPNDGADFLLPAMYAELAEARRTLDHHYGIDPGTTRFEVFDRPEDFGIRTVGVPQLGAVGVCFGPVITSIGPYTASHNFYMVAWHELAHVYAITLSRGRVPRWFTEGLSEWEASNANPAWTRRSTILLRAARREGRLRKLGELELAFVRAGSSAMMEVAYMTAAYAMRYLGETYGRAKLVDMLRGYGRGLSTAELMKTHLGKELSVVEAEFAVWFDAQLDQTITGWSPDPRRESDALNQRFEQAMLAAQEKRYDEAARLLQAMIQDGGDGFETRLLLGRVLMEGPGKSSAQTHFEKAAAFNLEDPTPFALLATLARDQKDTQGEITNLREVLSLDPVAFEANLSLLAIALAADDKSAISAATRRCDAVAPMHPACLGASALRALPEDKVMAKAHLDEALVVRQRIGADATTGAVLAIVADKLGQRGRAKELAERSKDGEALSSAVRAKLRAL